VRPRFPGMDLNLIHAQFGERWVLRCGLALWRAGQHQSLDARLLQRCNRAQWPAGRVAAGYKVLERLGTLLHVGRPARRTVHRVLTLDTRIERSRAPHFEALGRHQGSAARLARAQRQPSPDQVKGSRVIVNVGDLGHGRRQQQIAPRQRFAGAELVNGRLVKYGELRLGFSRLFW